MTIQAVIHRIRHRVITEDNTNYIIFQPTRTFRLDDVKIVNVSPSSVHEGLSSLIDDVSYVQIGHNIQSKFSKHTDLCHPEQQITIVLDSYSTCPDHDVVIELHGRELIRDNESQKLFAPGNPFDT